jgi:hypothetical protein
MTKQRRTWHELTPQQRGGIAVTGAIQVALLIAALLDLRRRPAARINGPKAVWIAAVFVNFIGPISYFIWGRKRTPPSTAARS